jgi:alkylated DNA nucleotide flippase Atl1
VGSTGKISLSPDAGGELQQNKLTDEGIDFTLNGTIDLEKYLWKRADKQ